MRAQGIEPRVRYIGKLGVAEVTAMARLVTTAKAEVLAAGIISTLKAEHLPRTPFTVALLAAIMMRGESLISNASPTAVLEQYVSHILGRDEPNQDSRLSLTSTDRESILADLARLFVERDQGSMLASDVLEQMEGLFQRFAWAESPAEVLADLVERRVLSYDGDQVRFTQSSFLHLFVAKAAIKDPGLLAPMVNRALYYGPVIRAYAGLIRHDTELLRDLRYLSDAATGLSTEGTAYASRTIDAPADLEDQIGLADVLPPEREGKDDGRQEQADPFFDASEDKDVLPFPLTTDDDLPLLARAIQGVALLSSVLRDSEEVDDLDLKTEVLASVLEGWGHVVDGLLEDESFAEMVLAMQDKVPEDQRNAFNSFAKVVPGLIVWAGISESLASRKLVLLLQRLVDDHEFTSKAQSAVTGAILVQAIHDPDWETQYGRLIEDHEASWFVQEVLALTLMVAFDQAPTGSAQEARVRDLATRIYLSGYRFDSQQQLKAVGAKYAQNLNARKAMLRAQLGGGRGDEDAV
jgi:hypothetical protein